jgi:hypothetical protein
MLEEKERDEGRGISKERQRKKARKKIEER